MEMVLAKPSRVPADSRDFCGRLRQLRDELKRPRENIEAAFLEVGDRLSQSATRLDRIVAAFAALPRDLDSPEMAEAMGRLDNFASHTRAISDAFATEGADIQRLIVAIDAATQPIDDLRRSVKMMGILAVNARIVAAGLNDAADRFDVFTTDIANLSDSAVRAVSAFSDGHGRLATVVHGAASQFSEFETAHRGVLTQFAGSLEHNLSEVAARRNLSASRSAETVRASREISARVASAVMALQVGDSTRQRVEHDEEALGDLIAWMSGEAAGGVSIPKPGRHGLSVVVLEIGEAQLKGTLEAFARDTDEAEQALRKLAGDAEIAVDESRRLYGSGGDGKQSSLASLGNELRRAAPLLRDCAAQRGRLDQMAKLVDETVEVLLGHVQAVQEIEANMRLVGLNAAVKCAQLGPRGASLSVIAQQLRELTGHLVPAAKTAVARLEEAMAAARTFSAASSGRLGQEVARLEEEAMAGIQLIEAVDGRLGEALLALDRDGPKATALLAEAAAGLGGHAEIAEALADSQMRFAELATEAQADTGVTDEASLAAALKHLRKAYSMEEERRIHDRIAGRILPNAAPPVETAPAEDSGDDVLFF
ncbi:MAG TPA: hypothetical protein VL418_07210 [Devosiaceae bacterium]|nr:hypothetical protein [Devosiaceae bacterium]